MTIENEEAHGSFPNDSLHGAVRLGRIHRRAAEKVAGFAAV
jgi:hypothetical protein